jgi:kynurenine formamidase
VAETRRRLIDLSHPIEDGMVTYPGLPAPEITEHLTREASRERYAPGTEFSIGRITMVANTGTYLDSPFHRFAEGPDLARLRLERTADLPGVVVRVPEDVTAIGVPDLPVEDPRGRAVLFHTGWDRHWRTAAYGSGSPFLTRQTAEWLVAQDAALVGIDSLNIDDAADASRPAHTVLLEAGIPIVEHLTGLDQLPADGFRLHAAPSAVVGFGTWPVRVYALVEG